MIEQRGNVEALRAENARLREALQELTDAAGAAMDHYHTGTPVWTRLYKPYKRARATLKDAP